MHTRICELPCRVLRGDVHRPCYSKVVRSVLFDPHNPSMQGVLSLSPFPDKTPETGPVAPAAAEGAGEDPCRPLPSFHTCVLSAYPTRLYSPRSELAQLLRLVDPAPGQALMLGSPGPCCRPSPTLPCHPRAPLSLVWG